MKHIKKFNESDSNFYTKISFEEYTTSDDELEAFDDVEIDFLNTMGFEKRRKHSDGFVTKRKYNDFPPFSIFTMIKKAKDEWYYVCYDSSTEPTTYYKCDQWEGLKELLEKLIKFPNN